MIIFKKYSISSSLNLEEKVKIKNYNKKISYLTFLYNYRLKPVRGFIFLCSIFLIEKHFCELNFNGNPFFKVNLPSNDILLLDEKYSDFLVLDC